MPLSRQGRRLSESLPRQPWLGAYRANVVCRLANPLLLYTASAALARCKTAQLTR
jgi:hypothetical protein